MRTILFLSVLMVLGAAAGVVSYAQDISFSTPNPVGSGARAIGMGGAFIGVADDATAASWNPGGLVQLKNPELSVVLGGFKRKTCDHFENRQESGATTTGGTATVTEEDVNYLSAVYPFNWLGRNMAVSLSYQKLYDFSCEQSDSTQFVSGSDVTEMDGSYRSSGSLSALGLAYSIQIVPRLSFGVTLNYWDDKLSKDRWKSTNSCSLIWKRNETGRTFRLEGDTSVEFEFKGFNANFGLFWRPNEKLSLGAVFKSPFTADSDFRVSAGQNESNAETYDSELDMPMSYGIGICYKFTEKFKISADAYRTEWEDFKRRYTDPDGGEFEVSPITGLPADESDVGATHQFRIGAEYLYVDPASRLSVPIRAGVFLDPSPAEGGSDDFWGASFGIGLSSSRFSLDFAYQYRFANDVNSSLVQIDDSDGFSQDVYEHTAYLSMIMYF